MLYLVLIIKDLEQKKLGKSLFQIISLLKRSVFILQLRGNRAFLVAAFMFCNAVF